MNISWKRGFKRLGWFLYSVWLLAWAVGSCAYAYSSIFEDPAYEVEVVWLTSDGRLLGEDILGKKEPLKDYQLRAVGRSWRHHADQVQPRARDNPGRVARAPDGQRFVVSKDGKKWEPISPEQAKHLSRRVHNTPEGKLAVSTIEGDKRPLTQEELNTVEPTHYIEQVIIEVALLFLFGGVAAPLVAAKLIAWLVAGFSVEKPSQG